MRLTLIITTFLLTLASLTTAQTETAEDVALKTVQALEGLDLETFASVWSHPAGRDMITLFARLELKEKELREVLFGHRHNHLYGIQVTAVHHDRTQSVARVELALYLSDKELEELEDRFEYRERGEYAYPTSIWQRVRVGLTRIGGEWWVEDLDMNLKYERKDETVQLDYRNAMMEALRKKAK